MSVFLAKDSSLRSPLEYIENIATSGAGGYLGINAANWITERSFSFLENSMDFAKFGALFYLVNKVTDCAFQRIFGEAKTRDTEFVISRNIVAGVITNAILVPLEISLTLKEGLIVFAAVQIAIKCKDRILEMVPSKGDDKSTSARATSKSPAHEVEEDDEAPVPASSS